VAHVADDAQHGALLHRYRRADLALATAKQALQTAEDIGDRNSIWESQLLLADSYLHRGDLAICVTKLNDLSEQASIRPPRSA
jgi:hypothetical protein